MMLGDTTAAAQNRSYLVGVVLIAGSVYGYGSGFGTLAPNDLFRGSQILGFSANPGAGRDFLVAINGTLPQAFFNRIVVQDSTGTWRVYTSASAVFSAVSSTSWAWGTGASPVWNSAASRGLVVLP